MIPLEAYFPTCLMDDCPQRQSGEHSHILLHQHDIMTYGLNQGSTVKSYLYYQGGVGSAKSVAYAARIVREMIEVRDNVGIVIRRDWDKLFQSCWLDIKKCVRKLVRLQYITDPDWQKKRQGEYTQITFAESNSILYAAQGKNWTTGLGASYGCFWVDDAMEMSQLLFLGDEVSAGLLSRLRLPEARYGKMLTNTNDVDSCNRLIGLVSSNPPPIGHWLHSLFGKDEGDFKLGDDNVCHRQVSSLMNPFVGDDYVKGLVAAQRKVYKGHRGDVNANIARMIEGKSKAAYGGIPVYPQFQHQKHVGSFYFNSAYPLIRSWDFGVLHPAVLFSNIFTCEHNTRHYITLSEISDTFDVTVYELYGVVKKHTDLLYKDAIIIDVGDRAGYRKSASNKDKRSDMKILISEYNLTFKHRYFDLIESIKYMRSLLERSTCKCGMEHVLIDNKCEVLISALEGGYRFTQNRSTGFISDKPLKDKYFDDVADAWRYGAENCVKWLLSHEDNVAIEQRRAIRKNQRSWDWMGMSDQDIGRLLIR